jgi:hypothetical protein
MLYGFVLLGWILLTAQLDRRSLWVDEFLTLQMIRGAPQDVIAASMADLHPPLYFLALHAWTGLAGASDFALRWLSIAFGILGLTLLPSIAQRLAGPRAVAPATLLLALSPAYIEFSRMARYYSLVLMLGLLSTQFLLDAIESDDGKRWLVYGLAGLALFYTFYPAAILLLAHGLVFILPAFRSRAARHWLVVVLIVGVAFLPWFGASAARQVTGLAANPGADLARSGLGFGLGIGASFYAFSVSETIFPWRPEAWIGIISVAGLLVVGLRRTPDPDRWRCAGLFAICIGFMSLVTNFVSVGTPFLNVPARGLFALPYYLLVVASGLAYVRSGRGRVILGGALLAVWSIGLFNYFEGQQFLNPIYLTPAKEAAAHVRQNMEPGDLVISDYDSVFGHYFLRGESTVSHLYTDRVGEIEDALRIGAPARVWLVTIGRDQTQRVSTADAVRQALSADYRIANIERMLPIDPIYLQAKNFILRRESYTHRLTIEEYVRHN